MITMVLVALFIRNRMTHRQSHKLDWKQKASLIAVIAISFFVAAFSAAKLL